MNYTTKPSRQWPEYVDVYCDGQFRTSCLPDRLDQVIARDIESLNRFWGEVFAEIGCEKLVIADGNAYSIGSDTDYPRGFGGRAWLITFHDGREVRTNSLWHCGDIPQSWRDRLPDNATLKSVY